MKIHGIVLGSLALAKLVQWKIGELQSSSRFTVTTAVILYSLPISVLVFGAVLPLQRAGALKQIETKRDARAIHLATAMSFWILAMVLVMVVVLPAGVWLAPITIRSAISTLGGVGLDTHEVANAWRVSWIFGLYVYLIILVIAPLVEEAYFRGRLLSDISERYGVNVAIGMSSVIFVLAHLSFGTVPHWTGLLHIGAGAVFYGVVFVKLGLKAAIAFHVLVNSWSATLVVARKISEI